MPADRFSPSRALPSHEVKKWDLETDVAVVGFGSAGACAAIEAANVGVRVTLFELAGGSGGASGLSGGEVYVGGGTPVQLANGFEDDVESLYTYLIMAGGPDADKVKTRLFAENSVGHFHWLVEQGMPYKGTFVPGKLFEPETDDTLIWSGSEEAWPFSEAARPAPRSHTVQFQGFGGGRKLMDVFEAQVRALSVDVRCNARALCLVADEDGGVAGIVVRIEGKEQYVRAIRGVILCAGGFCMNQEMMRRHAPNALRSSDPLGVVDDGSGILMGQSVGGSTIHMDQYFMSCIWYPPEDFVKGIMVDINGQRFINEDCYHGRVATYITRQPQGKAYLLVDNSLFDRPNELTRINLAATGETWEEVERELGMTPGALTSTLEIFNREAAQGRDPLFHKASKWLKPLTEGPFAAFELNIATCHFPYFTLGGLETLPSGEVLSRDGEPIRGLYAAGRTACGIPRWGEGYNSGISLSDCTFSGRMAGRTAGGRPLPDESLKNT